jgi:serine/arginine repetitive matrix protein 2
MPILPVRGPGRPGSWGGAPVLRQLGHPCSVSRPSGGARSFAPRRSRRFAVSGPTFEGVIGRGVVSLQAPAYRSDLRHSPEGLARPVDLTRRRGVGQANARCAHARPQQEGSRRRCRYAGSARRTRSTSPRSRSASVTPTQSDARPRTRPHGSTTTLLPKFRRSRPGGPQLPTARPRSRTPGPRSRGLGSTRPSGRRPSRTGTPRARTGASRRGQRAGGRAPGSARRSRSRARRGRIRCRRRRPYRRPSRGTTRGSAGRPEGPRRTGVFRYVATSSPSRSNNTLVLKTSSPSSSSTLPPWIHIR